ncbi:uncharacterized protein N7443_008161 [Penicillium atrosanguineum]|uniref:uncharacterized protein n=1 Tax=Penicillium atrosanguineum TaxID=1132637 RepID=UPI002391EFE7|nr:uncharacterized protein N7443_008161 [Penicillium atrosanguineum]KAJ5297268.1 hypothetical protein N7443_008161 [Penicillium atrosanguineum]
MAAMNISLDKISFYSHPPTKSSSRDVAASRWRPYQASLAPQTLPRAPPPRPQVHGTTFNSESDASLDVSPQIRAPVREALDSHAGSEFDIEIGRAMRHNSQVTHETDLDMPLDSGLLNECRIDVPQSNNTSLFTDPPVTPTVTPTDLLRWRRDSISSLGTYDETDNGPAPPEVNLHCPRVMPSPLPDLPAWPSIDTIIQDESVEDDTMSGPENNGGRTGVLGGEVTIQSVQVNEPSISEAISDEDEGVRLTEESQAPVIFRHGPRTRSIKQSKATLASTCSLRPRPNADSTRPEQFPAVSVVIPARRVDESAASTKTNAPARARRSNWGGSGDFNNDGTMRASTGEYSPFSGGSNSKTTGHPPKRPKRAKQNHLAPSNAIVVECTTQSPMPSKGGGLAVTSGETQEIFGRGVLRIEARGPRHAYFMTFLPEVSHRPSMAEMPPDQSSRSEGFSENASSRLHVKMEMSGPQKDHGIRDLVIRATRSNENPGGVCRGLRKR